jgi:hypothetical protein
MMGVESKAEEELKIHELFGAGFVERLVGAVGRPVKPANGAGIIVGAQKNLVRLNRTFETFEPDANNLCNKLVQVIGSPGIRGIGVGVRVSVLPCHGVDCVVQGEPPGTACCVDSSNATRPGVGANKTSWFAESKQVE